jgi:tetratricopeptide (TPR) repeat protein
MSSDSPIPPTIDTDNLKEVINLMRQHYRDRAWLIENEEEVHRTIQRGLNLNATTLLDSVDLALGVMNVTLTLESYPRWNKLLVEVFNAVLRYKPELIPDVAEALSFKRIANDNAGEIRTKHADIYMLGGKVKQAQDKLEIALEKITQALQYAEDERLEDQPILREIMLMVYIGFFRTETFTQSAYFKPEYIQEALYLAYDSEDFYHQALLYQALSGVYTHRGELTKALGYGMTSLGYFHARTFHHPEAFRASSKSALILGGAYRIHGLYKHAQQMFEKALEYSQSMPLPDTAQLNIISYELAVVAMHNGDYETARDNLLKAHEYYSNLKAPNYQASTSHSLGLVYTELKEFDEAEMYFKAAIAAWDKLNHPLNRAAVQRDRGYMEEKRGDIGSAVEYWADALVILYGLDPNIKLNQMMKEWLTEQLRKYGFSDADLALITKK